MYSTKPVAMTFLEEGNCSMNNGDYEMAIEHYERCLNVANENSLKMMAYFSIGNAYTLSNKLEEGLNYFNLCLNLSSKVETKYFQHKVYLGLGSVHSTATRLKEAIKKDEVECLCHIALGGLNKSLGKYEKSLEHYRKGFSFIDCEHQEEEMQPRQRKENQQGNQQEQNKRRERPRRPRKVGGINVSKDFVKHNLKNLSIVTSAGIVSGVLAVLWELAELFDKLEQYREAADIYEMYLGIVPEDEGIEKQEKAMEYLIQIYDEEERYLLRNSMEAKLQEIIKKKNEKELQLQEWKYLGESTKHKKLFQKLVEYGRNPSIKVEYVGDVCVIFSDEFCIGKGSDGTRVYLGLGKDGYGRAVKRIRRDNNLALQEDTIFNESNAQKSEYVVNYSYLEQDNGTEYVYLILDLCEESLESFVKSSTLKDLQKSLPEILRQILKGLADLHSEPRPILHRDLKPSNVLRDAQGKFLIADFGISRILKDGRTTYSSIAKCGTEYWIAPESYCGNGQSIDKARFKRQSDVMNAGMVAYYVATKGKHPFGPPEYRLKNLFDGNPVGLKEIDDVQLKDLLLWMLQRVPELRPSANEALKHPYLQSYEKNFDMLCDVANPPVIEIPYLGHPLNSDVHEQLNGLKNWMDRIEPEVFSNFNKSQYDSTWLGCLKFLQNVHQNWHDKPLIHIKEGNYEEYFLRVFPELPLLVHRITRFNDWKTKPDLEEHFTKLQLKEWKYFDQSIKHKEKFLKLIKYGRDPDIKVECVNDVRVIFSDEFCIGIGNNGTRVYLGLKKDGYGKAVKRIRRDICTNEAENEMKILNEIKAKKSSYVVNYYHLEEDTGTEYVYLILDLCEESLESFVKSSTLEDLQKSLPEILKQILKGLADLHSEPNPILHRDLKPSNVFRDAQGQYLIADFGSSRILKNGLKTHVSDATKGTQYWIAPESYVFDEESFDKARYKPESDVMNAGMVAYFVATKGKHPFGTIEYRLHNMLKGKPVGLKEIKDAVLNDLLSWMLQLKPEDRPSANKALKHPYLLSDEEKFDMLCDLGNQPEMKKSQCRNSSTSDVHKQLYGHTEWMKRIDDEVLKDFIKFKVNNKKSTVTYESSWASCLRFIRNVDQHWHDKPRPRLSQYIQEGNYKEYFLQAFPELPLLVHKVIRSTDWKTRPDLKKHFTKSSSFSYICLEEPRSSSSTFKDEPSTPSGSTGDFKKILNSITSLSFKSPSKTDEPSTPNTVEFKKRFLTKDHKIKNSVHENLKSFPWLCGKYGIARPTDELNYRHMYLEVDESKTEDVLKQEIDNKFKWKASDYIELRYVDPRKKIEIQQLSNNVMVSRHDDPNKSHSTLTLFCCKDEQHYALTCAHVGYPKSIPEDQRTFLYIRHQRENEARAVNYLHENKYFYIPKKTTEIALGKLAAYSYNQETDIMAILVDDKATKFTAAEIEVPGSFDDIIGYLSENVGIQKVYKAGRESGENTIFDVNYSFPSNENETPSYRDVVAVKSDHEFLEKGDSGSLIYCYDENMKKIPFAYGIAKVNDGDETYYVCMRLKDGLKNLGLLENVSFKDFSRVKN
ncbi:uncharacterized protein LOC124438449 isoform X2 [Xenia sp. Carnegie-2017]|uniref:uncharacterized protein LOC124438449 isoform X2 n=1 Tax=Xenia sp. Carnegie-2017 TaxID=2897299 RepID=UPI001F04FBEB|nr:uncharacterized protein LOC124438449 isoform X2 [Xenia sp. Carnegie-2017]